MNTNSLYLSVCQQCSSHVAGRYSTSFASAIRLLHKDLQAPICAIYGFVRFADEIVDTFLEHDQESLLRRFREDTWVALEEKISLNPVLHAFQETVHRFRIDRELIEAFFQSMEMDLSKKQYQARQELETYIYGSAEVVGLMCLYIFCEGDRKQYEALKEPARALGAAFQKVNFLRDFGDDFRQLQRVYFPGLDLERFDEQAKKTIEADIAADFANAYEGILQLPVKARFGVYVAYRYYLSLFGKICRLPPSLVLAKRIRIPNLKKLLIVAKAGVKNQLRLI